MLRLVHYCMDKGLGVEAGKTLGRGEVIYLTHFFGTNVFCSIHTYVCAVTCTDAPYVLPSHTISHYQR